MVTDPQEIEIISRARQKNVADPMRSREHFYRIFQDFLSGIDFSGQSTLDLGPGHWDFSELARERGARRGIGVDNDPAVLELGRYKGFDAIEGNLKMPEELSFTSPINGLFCKFALNAFWYWTDEVAARNLVKVYVELVKDLGWIWVAPWNGVPSNGEVSEDVVREALRWQREEFLDAGCVVRELSLDEAKYYGVNGKVANNVIYTRGI